MKKWSKRRFLDESSNWEQTRKSKLPKNNFSMLVSNKKLSLKKATIRYRFMKEQFSCI